MPNGSPERTPAGRLASLVVPPLALMVLIFVLSAQPDEAVDRAFWEIVLRKLGHVTEYAALTYLWWRAFDGLRPGSPIASTLTTAVIVSALYACSDELHQTFVDGRNGTPVDVLIDSIGIALACTYVVRAQARRRRRTVGPSRPSAA